MEVWQVGDLLIFVGLCLVRTKATARQWSAQEQDRGCWRTVDGVVLMRDLDCCVHLKRLDKLRNPLQVHD